MNKQLALAYAATSVATAIAAIAVVGSAFGFGGNPTEPPIEEPTGVLGSVTELRDSLVQQAIAEVEAQRAEAQATALSEVEAWRAAAISEIEAQLAAQVGAVQGVSGDTYAYANYEKSEHDEHDEHEEDEEDEHDEEDEEDEEDEHDEHKKREKDDD